MDIRDLVGVRVKTARRLRGMSQADLAAQIERTLDAVSAIERGKSLPNIETLNRLSRVLGIPAKDFFDDSTESSSPRRAAHLAEITMLLRDFSDAKLLTATELIRALAKAP
ncbi:hypothetical protein AKG11_33105 [Shinella sp. SUS2]|uniref:helix-turn-helix domain-containing protein n=1 Tax=unclassified Shinella TaxID=2643062 RepID=UPI0006A4FBD2|nr:hypothetical protein AKG11_33105 [Shinella sp. SUS2]KOC71451.1 hypothetical protein AKG10_32970 [Shinella sp. GWS1]